MNQYLSFIKVGTYMAGLGAFVWAVHLVTRSHNPNFGRDNIMGPTGAFFRWVVFPLGLLFLLIGGIAFLQAR